MKTAILELLPDELALKIDGPRYRAGQVFRWLHRERVERFADMSDLPRRLRDELDARFEITPLEVLACREADDGSVKRLFRAGADGTIETVVMPAAGRRTMCISTQVGCKFGCRFCASGAAGFQRNLSAGEIVAQVHGSDRLGTSGPATHIVVMGMGEPFDNYDNLVRALRVLNHPLGRGIGKRRITISTVGLPRRILEFAELGMPFELSVSLHSAIDKVRAEIMPVNRAFPVRTLLDACWRYTEAINRVITFEYILIDGLNCDDRNADAMITAMRGRRAKVNLIPYNPIAEFPGRRPPLPAIRRFESRLREAGIAVTVRFSKAGSVDGACGQLRLRTLQGEAVATDDAGRRTPVPGCR